jgi:cysteinyl-tRNA synthetase
MFCSISRSALSLCAGFSLLVLTGCPSGPETPEGEGEGEGEGSSEGMVALDYRQEMRSFVEDIAGTARDSDADFIVIPQNGHELLSSNGESDGPVATAYVNAINGVGREDLFYGYDNDNVATPADERNYMLGFMDRFEALQVEVLVTDYVSAPAGVSDSYSQNALRNYISFAADERDLTTIPSAPFNENSADIQSLSDARNFLYLLNPDRYATVEALLSALQDTNFDVFIIDLFYGDTALTAAQIQSLKTKAIGGSRLVIAYMSIGEAEDYRYYWEFAWSSSPPTWLAAQNPNWPGNYKVRYWDPQWQALILGEAPDAYLNLLLGAGVDGVYLDIIDAFEFFEN